MPGVQFRGDGTVPTPPTPAPQSPMISRTAEFPASRIKLTVCVADATTAATAPMPSKVPAAMTYAIRPQALVPEDTVPVIVPDPGLSASVAHACAQHELAATWGMDSAPNTPRCWPAGPVGGFSFVAWSAVTPRTTIMSPPVQLSDPDPVPPTDVDFGLVAVSHAVRAGAPTVGGVRTPEGASPGSRRCIRLTTLA